MKAKINDVEIEYQEVGAGPAVLFIHDSAPGRDLPEDLFKPLAEAGYRVVLTRLQGLGEADGFDPAPHARNAVSLLNYLGIGRAVVFGIGLGGTVLLELVEKFPRRVAASSLVVSPTTAKDLRKLAKLANLKGALQEGRLDEVKKAILNTLPKVRGERLSASVLNQLRSWIGRVRSRKQQPVADGEPQTALLAGMELPPPLLADDPVPVRSRSLAHRGWEKLMGLNAPFLALLNFLLPGEETDEDEVLTDLG